MTARDNSRIGAHANSPPHNEVTNPPTVQDINLLQHDNYCITQRKLQKQLTQYWPLDFSEQICIMSTLSEPLTSATPPLLDH